MIPRGVLDIRWPTLLWAMRQCLAGDGDSAGLLRETETFWNPDRQAVACLSVRSGLDLVLSALDWPAGSEIVMSAVNIPAMSQIIEEHGLVPVPVDVAPQSLAPDIDQLRTRLTPRTRAILVAHLFGSRLDLDEVAEIARANGLQLWEDVAQGFTVDGFRGHPAADVSFFSFGLIKSQTALGGAVLQFRDPVLADRCRVLQAAWPERAFRQRVGKSLGLQFLGLRPAFTVLAGMTSLAGRNLDEWIAGSVRGFRPQNLLEQLRQRPCRALLALLHRRLTNPEPGWVARKDALAREYRRRLPPWVLLGGDATFPTHWVLPIRSCDPQGLQARLRRAGFDATTRGSQLRVVPPPAVEPSWATPAAAAWIPQLIYLPLHPALTLAHIAMIAGLVESSERAGAADGGPSHCLENREKQNSPPESA
ncbi:MAG: DegT/DnrJ/EryC1/StrS family aminotransferase [Planctomycetaceae bacterium]|nr:DegT/DnrJ/EryC1/StrS family aminotransferase [Planctomycetaceae bacterium]